MKISELTVEPFKVKEPANSIYDDSLIADVVYSGISDDLKKNKWCIVFGSGVQIKERVKAVIDSYHNDRFEKLILCDGNKGISNTPDAETEAIRFKRLIMETGIPESIIYLEEQSQNTFENIDNAMSIIEKEDGNIDSLSIITSEYHLKRCILAFAKKYPSISVTTIPAYDGYSDRTNWFNSSNEWNHGRCMVLWERNLLTKYAQERKIADSEIKR